MSIKAVVGQTVTEGNRYVGGETNTIIITVDDRSKTIFGDIKEKFINTLQPKIVHLEFSENPEHQLAPEDLKVLTDNDANNVRFNNRIYYLTFKTGNELIYNNFDEDHYYRFLNINSLTGKYIYRQYKVVDDIDFEHEVNRLDERINNEILRATTVEEAIYTLIGNFDDHTDNTVLGYFNNNAIGTIEFSHNPATGKMHYLWKDILGEVDYENDLQLNTDEIIIAADLDYENKKIIYTLAGIEETESGEEVHKTIECDISKMIDDYEARAAHSLSWSQDRNSGVVTVNLHNFNNQIIDTKTLDLDTEYIIRDIELDYVNKQLICTLNDNEGKDASTFTVDLSDMIDDYDQRLEDIWTEIGEYGDGSSEPTIYGHLKAEEERAIESEQTLQENLDLETERAIVAEEVLDGKLDDEIARATQSETDIQNDLDAYKQSNDQALADEIAARESGDEELLATINALDLAQVGADGSYIKFVNQEDGQLSASSQTFDTTIPSSNPSAINTPTTSAVKTYVDNADTNIQNQLNAHKADKNNPHEVTTEQIQAVSYGRPQSLNNNQKLQAKTNISLELVENYPQALGTEYKAAESATSKKYFPLKGAYNLFNELYDDASDIQNEIDQIGEVVGYQRQMELIPGNSGEEDEYSYVGNIFNYTYELDPNGFIQKTKNLADQNKSRLDNIENNITGLTVDNSGINVSKDLTVAGDLIVKGTTTTSDQQTIQSESTIIVTNSTNAPLTRYSGTVALKGYFEEHNVNAENYHAGYFYYIDDSIDDPTARVIVIDGHKYVLDESPTYTEGRQYYSQCAEAIGLYDKNEDAVVIGEGNYYGGNFEFDTKYSVIELTVHTYIPNKYYILVDNQYILATGDFDPNETYYLGILQGQHLATRADSNSLVNGHLLAWDATAYTLVDSGKSIGILETEHQKEITDRQDADNAIWNEIGQKTDKAGTETVYGYIDYERGERKAGDTRLRNDFELALNSTEARLQENLDNETERAVVAETILQDQIEELAGGTESSLADEIAARESGDEALSDRIDDVLEDIGDIHDQWDESGNQTVYGYINKETERAQDAENMLQNNINDVVNDIGEITDQWDESGNNTVYAYINKERDRATDAETAIQNSIGTTSDPSSTNTVYGHIKAEEERATQVEGNLANDINTVNVTAVKNVVYENNTNNIKAIRTVINQAHSDVVDINTLKSDMALNNLTNDRQVVGLAPATDPETHEPVNYNNHILLFDTDGYHIKDSGWTLDDTGKIDSISINGTDIPAVNKNVDLPPYPTEFFIRANATDGLFDITGVGGYNEVTYSFAPYSAKQQASSFYNGSVDPTLTTRLNYDGYLYATKLYSNGSETVTNSVLKKLDTTNTTSLVTSSNETIVDAAGNVTINLHKVSKTGKFEDLVDVSSITSQEINALFPEESEE